jgi:hypothetical protein
MDPFGGDGPLNGELRYVDFSNSSYGGFPT